jgi:secondary thiamine-phosphate synthase enzyme
MWLQREISIPEKQPGFYLVTDLIRQHLPELQDCHIGLLHVQLLHTSASLTLNENADPDVRTDLMAFLSRLVPDGADYFQHVLEGPDDMSAHIKASLLGTSLSVAVSAGRLNLGIWQGIYLGEHRDRAGPRKLLLTLQGEFVCE